MKVMALEEQLADLAARLAEAKHQRHKLETEWLWLRRQSRRSPEERERLVWLWQNIERIQQEPHDIEQRIVELQNSLRLQQAAARADDERRPYAVRPMPQARPCTTCGAAASRIAFVRRTAYIEELRTRRFVMAAACSDCGTAGPEIPTNDMPPMDAWRLALAGWNLSQEAIAADRLARLAPQQVES